MGKGRRRGGWNKLKPNLSKSHFDIFLLKQASKSSTQSNPKYGHLQNSDQDNQQGVCEEDGEGRRGVGRKITLWCIQSDSTPYAVQLVLFFFFFFFCKLTSKTLR